MPDRRRTIVQVAVAIALVLAFVAVRHPRAPASAPGGQGRAVGHITAAERAATFTFGAEVQPYDRQVILDAVARARPAARRLIDDVDGLITVDVGDAGEHAVGLTQSTGDRFKVTLNLGAAARDSAQRGMDRLILHELGHVVNFALVPDSLVEQLDAQVPTRYGCQDGVTGACTNPTEVFAETFAKWATGDIGMYSNLGYAVPPPPDLDAWGRPLERLPGA